MVVKIDVLKDSKAIKDVKEYEDNFNKQWEKKDVLKDKEKLKW